MDQQTVPHGRPSLFGTFASHFANDLNENIRNMFSNFMQVLGVVINEVHGEEILTAGLMYVGTALGLQEATAYTQIVIPIAFQIQQNISTLYALQKLYPHAKRILLGRAIAGRPVDIEKIEDVAKKHVEKKINEASKQAAMDLDKELKANEVVVAEVRIVRDKEDDVKVVATGYSKKTKGTVVHEKKIKVEITEDDLKEMEKALGCTSDSDCISGFGCSDNVCRKRCIQDVCPLPYVCKNGYCILPSKPRKGKKRSSRRAVGKAKPIMGATMKKQPRQTTPRTRNINRRRGDAEMF